MHRWLLIFVLAVSNCAAVPSLSYPFYTQNPSLARYGEAYQYRIPVDTFISTESVVHYSADKLPSWLSFNSNTRLLSGTPQGQGDQNVTFDLIATDSSGSSNATCNIFVTDSKAPEINNADDITAILQQAGPVANSNSLVISPGKQFSISFPQDFFVAQSDRKILYTLGLSSSHAPLPIWLKFDQSKNQFSGTAPYAISQIAPSQQFSILYAVSDYAGFISASVEFNIMVGAHQLTSNIISDTINVEANNSFQYAVPLSSMTLDGHPLQPANLSNLWFNGSLDWLKVDRSHWSLVGFPPESLEGSTEQLQVTLADSFGDEVVYDLAIDIVGKNNTIFTSTSLNPVNASAGDDFQYSIAKFLNEKDVDIAVHYTPDAPWLNYHANNFTFTGTVPGDFAGTTVTLDATTPNSRKRDTESAVFQINSYKKATDSTSDNPEHADTSYSSGDATSARRKTILLGVLVPCAFLLAIFFLWLCFLRQRQNRDDTETGSSRAKKGIPKISRPILNQSPQPFETSSTSTASPSSESLTDNEYMDPEKHKFDSDWVGESPQRASLYNYLKMENDGNASFDSDATHADTSGSTEVSIGIKPLAINKGSPLVTAPTTPLADELNAVKELAQPVIGMAVTSDMNVGPVKSGIPAYFRDRTASNTKAPLIKPRNSWRQKPNDRDSHDSLASIATDELLTVRMIDEEPHSSFMQPTQSCILTPRHSMKLSNASSGIIQPLGSDDDGHSHSSSIGSYSSSGEAVRASTPVPLGHANEQTIAGSTSESDISFRTADSGEEGYDEDNIRAYRNSRGQLTWSQNDQEQFGSDADDDATETSQTPRQSSRRNTVRLVDFTKAKRGSTTNDITDIIQRKPSIAKEHSSKAEIAFI